MQRKYTNSLNQSRMEQKQNADYFKHVFSLNFLRKIRQQFGYTVNIQMQNEKTTQLYIGGDFAPNDIESFRAKSERCDFAPNDTMSFGAKSGHYNINFT